MNNIKISIFNSPEWDKCKADILAVEQECFAHEPDLITSEEYFKEMVDDTEYIIVIASDGNKIVGHAYGYPLEMVTKEDFDGYWDPATYTTYGKNNTFYTESIAVLPAYQKKGIGTSLKKYFLDHARSVGIKFVIGHSHEGVMMDMNKKLGAEVIQEFPNWFDTGEKHDLYEINVWKQDKDFNCGPYALSYYLLQKVNKYFSPYELEKFLGSNAVTGTSPKLMKNFVNESKIQHFAIYEADVDDMQVPCIVNYQYEGDGHYAVVMGKVGHKIRLYNPTTGVMEYMEEEEFEKVWFSKRYGPKFLLV